MSILFGKCWIPNSPSAVLQELSPWCANLHHEPPRGVSLSSTHLLWAGCPNVWFYEVAQLAQSALLFIPFYQWEKQDLGRLKTLPRLCRKKADRCGCLHTQHAVSCPTLSGRTVVTRRPRGRSAPRVSQGKPAWSTGAHLTSVINW